MRRAGGWRAAIILGLALLAGSAAARTPAKIPVRVVVVTTFEIGKDSGDTPGEFQNWVERLPLDQSLPFKTGMRPLRYNAAKGVLGIVTGSGSINSAASIMALGLDPRFDLSHAYWIIAGIAGINPNQGSVGSAAWAEWVVDRDLAHEIDAREIPAGWATGVVPLDRATPYQGSPPPPGIYSPNAYHLEPALVAWAYGLTKDTLLADTADLKGIRARYPDQPEAQKPPHVMRGDEVSGMNWWLGWQMNRIAEDWMSYWSGGKGVSATTAMEDTGVIRALQMLAPTGNVDPRRVLVLRTASNYSAPAKGQTAAQLLESETNSTGGLSAFIPSLQAAYAVGSVVVNEISGHWAKYKGHMP